ncbi:hypothetical protein HYN59_16555 [Flavobacterium album]|uniref:Uncharacterized protein n=1 Tax=Flavobacterium album TaxID=2175091 RepID=A0A2S1R263_9FLAO|nr:hypothetical protein [Flavobacterium album]AWH86621.1 hypothetical protein HYN59_16555 [Flavobacterium album]
MHTGSDIREVVLKYTLDTSDDIALNCDHWTATDFAGAIDSGLLKYEGWSPMGSPDSASTGGAITVFISISIETDDPVLQEEDFTSGLIDAFQIGACVISHNDDHTVNVTVRGIIRDHTIHRQE